MKIDWGKIGLTLGGIGCAIGSSLIGSAKTEKTIKKEVEKGLIGFQPQEVKDEEPAPAAEEENAE